MQPEMSTAQWADFDHLQMAAMEDPAPMLAELGRQCPVGRSELYGGFYVLTRYADCVAASRDRRLASSNERGPGPGFPVSSSLPLMSMINDDDRRHRDFRRPLQEVFSASAAERMAPRIREICTSLVDEFIELGEADLADDYSAQVPAILTSELLDLPRESRREFEVWSHELVAKGGATDALGKMLDYTADLYDLRRASPGDDLPSMLLDITVEGKPIERDDWRGLVVLLVLAGLDTTANAGALALHLIGQRPELRQYLLEDFSRIPVAVEEMLRWLSPVPQHSRGVTEDLEIGGHQFLAGDVVQLNWLAANRDPDEFPDADTFVADRSPNRHLAFGSGVHRCLGLHLAQVEMRIMLEEVLGRLPDYEIVDGGVERYPSLNRGMSHLRVRFTPGPRIG